MPENNTNQFDKNTQTIIEIREKLLYELEAIEATKNEGAVEVMKDVSSIMESILGTGIIRARGASTDMTDLASIIRSYLRYLETILAGGILTPLTGREEEWVDIAVAPNASKEIVQKFRGQDYIIAFKSVQVNKRYSNIYRFNKDNKYAHRVDMIQFYNVNKPSQLVVNNCSLRFIQFPYTLDQIRIPAILDEEGHFLRTVDGETIEDLMDNIAFRTTGGTVIGAPVIPFPTLRREGVNWGAEVSAVIGADANR